MLLVVTGFETLAYVLVVGRLYATSTTRDNETMKTMTLELDRALELESRQVLQIAC